MKAGRLCPVVLIVFITQFRIVPAGAEPLALNLRANGPQLLLSWPAALFSSNQSLVFPEFQVQYSSDLQSWKPLTGRMQGVAGRSGPLLSRSVDNLLGPLFYRLRANLDPDAPGPTANGGDEVFGYNDVFTSELQQLGQLPIEDFATNGANIGYLPGLSWDPATAQFWSLYAPGLPGSLHLTSAEAGLLMTNGFVVSERLGSSTFGDSYYQLFNADLPVFVTADSVLHAWHRSYQSMMEELEELQLSTSLAGIVSNMSLQLPLTWQQYGAGPLKDSILDADLFLSVARSLWAGKQVPSAIGRGTIDQQVTALLSAIQNESLQCGFEIFGGTRTIDFSQFKVRGHYDASDRLRRYFKTAMWCGRTDLRLATFPPNQEDDIRQIGTALVLQYLLVQSGQLDNWSDLERVTQAFVGLTDSMTFSQMGGLLGAAGINSPADVPDLVTLTNLQTRLLTGELGVQSIHSDFFWSPYGSAQLRLPRSFTFCGQKFVPDSWAMSQTVFDRIHWRNNNSGALFGDKVIRRKPSCLDVAFSVLANDQTVPELVARILNTNGVTFRDGLPYQHNLLAVRKVMDAQADATWNTNMYNAWLAALRALSAPTTEPKYPEAMRTRAWAMKTLNTQLASWTELRHDTLLYAKQSYTEPGLCSYPYGFVEPRPEFWQQMQTLAAVSGAAISRLPMSGMVTVQSRDPLAPGPLWFDLSVIKANQIAFCQAFSSRMIQLQGLAQKELNQQTFTQPEVDFLRSTIEAPQYYTGVRQFNGWYPGLFYTNRLGGPNAVQVSGCVEWDTMVADVHTDLPDPNVDDPGAVIHEAIGNVHLLVIAIDNGSDRMLYAGPVLSHYEFEVPGLNRLSDSDWKTRLYSSLKPPSPDWTRSYLIPNP